MQSLQYFWLAYSRDPLRDLPCKMFVHDQKMKGKKKHAPAWCARIICFGEILKHQNLSRGDSGLSDHCLVREIFVAESDVPSDSWSLGSSWSDSFLAYSFYFSVLQ
jgi:hypothetical protein